MAIDRRSRGAVLCAALCAVTLAACSQEPSSGIDSPPDAGDPSTVPGQAHGPKLFVSPAGELTFGEVAFFGEGIEHPSATRKLVLFDVGDAPLRIEHLKLEANAAGADGLELVLPESWPGTTIEPVAGKNHFEVELRLTPKALGHEKWTLSFESNDPDAPRVQVDIVANVVTPPPCQFKVSPEELEAGPVYGPEVFAIQVTNQGVTPVQQCLLSEAQLIAEPGTPLQLSSSQTKPQILRAGETGGLNVYVTALPPSLDEQTYEATLQFQVSPSESERVSVPLRVRVAASRCLQVAPSWVDFGPVDIACAQETRTLTLYNTCSEPIYLTNFSVDGAALQPGAPQCQGSSPCPQFSILQSPAIPIGGLELPPGSASPPQMQVRFRPIFENTAEGSITFTVKQGSTLASYRTVLEGTGVPGSFPTTDRYSQPTLPKLDVLLVVDDSPSMAAHQASVASNLSAFLSYLKAVPINLQLGVISADPAAGAGLISGPQDPDKVLTRSSNDLDNQFAAKVNVGTSGAGAPQCLAQALAALSPPLVNGANSGFLRSKAELEVVCITDSTDNSPLPVADYISDLQALKPSTSMFVFNAAGGFTMSCPGDASGRLADAVSLSLNGVTADLCAPDWHTDFENFVFGGFVPHRDFHLTSLPRSGSTITVMIDGVPVASTTSSGDTVWTYDATYNAVVFEPMYMPAEGQQIDISYLTASCYP